MTPASEQSTVRVWYSNQLEQLASRLVKNFEANEQRPPTRLFAMPPIIVPNRNIETYLKYQFARQAGIAAALNFQVIESFLAGLLPKAEPLPRLLTPKALRAFFLAVLSAELDGPGALPKAVRDYLDQGGRDPDARDLRRYQLAARLARLGGQYGDTRPELLEAWADGRASLTGDSRAGTEEWQRMLWGRLTHLACAQVERGIRWILPSKLFDLLDKVGFVSPREVHFFGFSYVWRGLQEMIKHLHRQSLIHIYTVAPFVEFQEDLTLLGSESSSGPRFSRRASGRGKRARHGNAISPDDLPIVAHWSRPGREFFWMLDEIGGADFRPDFVTNEGATSLGRLQCAILERSSASDVPYEDDGSLVITACPGIRREAEFIANEIWSLIHDDERQHRSSPDRLRFPDIAVLLADAMSRPAYQSHLRAVFDDLHGIPFNMVDLPLAGECRVIEAVLLLLALPLGRFTRPELLQVLTHPAVRARFPDSDVDQWRDWCLELEIVHGADQSDHAGTYIDRELFHWEQGLRRLILGCFMTGPHCGDDRAFRLGDLDYLPHDQPADALASLGRLLVLVRSLVSDARFARSAQLTMTEWSTFLAGMIHTYLTADSDAEERALLVCLQRVHDLQDLDVTGCKLGYRIACESLRDALEGLKGTRGHYLADGVVVAPLLAMRSLPFRVVFLCGLGEGRFPATDGPDPLDLTVARRRLGDVSPRERDKYLFLETIACARERLYLSYVARDSQTGDVLEPSSVVHELMGHLHTGRTGKPPDFWVKKQPLRRYDDSYFPEQTRGGTQTPSRRNFSLAARQEHNARKLRKALGDRCKGLSQLTPQLLCKLNQPLSDWLGFCSLGSDMASATPFQSRSVSFHALRRFLECPLQGWARQMLELSEDEEEDETAREDEPFVMGRLDEAILLREVFLDALGREMRSSDPADFGLPYNARVDSRMQRGLMPVGLFSDAERHRHLSCLSAWYESAKREGLLGTGQLCVYQFGRAGEDERVDLLESTIPIDVPVTDVFGEPRTVCVELFGRTQITSRDQPASMTFVVRDTVKDKDFLAGFLDAVILAMLPGHHDTAAYHAHIITTRHDGDLSKYRRTFRGIDQERARGFLTNLVADLLNGPHSYLLPCEAVFKHLGPKQTSIESSVERMKEDNREPCSSRYGPVPNFEQYDALGEDQARQIVERRFGLFRDSGGMGG
jgi:exodeoxyribonuclease V gamma subunit